VYKFDSLEWDELKRLATIADRDLDFADARQIFEDARSVTFASSRQGEKRFKTIGLLRGRLTAVIHTPRRCSCRIISLRRAHGKEKEAYYDNG
jgi:uncharacterized DUF497 family protein